MRFLLQRVSRAAVTVEGEVVGRIGGGLLVFVGLGEGDQESTARALIEKTALLRIFNDERGQLNRSLEDIEGSVLIVSQFTLYADAKKGRRPSYTGAMAPDAARALFGRVVALFEERLPGRVQQGIFAAHMAVDLVNDGPVTIWLDSQELGLGR